jgi:HEAT repeat protein
MTGASPQNVDQLLTALGGKDASERAKARQALIQMGSAAVLGLRGALAAPQQHVRWEAAKSLAEIADPSAAHDLVSALGDPDGDVRWVAGEALIALNRDGLRPLLTKLTESDLPEGMYQAAHHVLRALARNEDLDSWLQPVIKALEGHEPAAGVPVAAGEALRDSDL